MAARIPPASTYNTVSTETLQCMPVFDSHQRSGSCYHGAVRLVNGTSIHEGRVEICLLGTWKTVCDHNWNDSHARIVCVQLGYPYEGILITPFRLCMYYMCIYPQFK